MFMKKQQGFMMLEVILAAALLAFSSVAFKKINSFIDKKHFAIAMAAEKTMQQWNSAELRV